MLKAFQSILTAVLTTVWHF